jgi:hypothetical protein
MRGKVLWVLPFVLLAVMASCDEDPLAPFEPEVNNATNSFQLQATGVTNVSTTLSYTWTNTGTSASVNHSTTTTAGTARVDIRSANNTMVYDKALSPSLNEASDDEHVRQLDDSADPEQLQRDTEFPRTEALTGANAAVS